MSNYAKLTNFATKDTLASGNPLKVIKGTEIDDEFEDIETHMATKADLASPVLTGTPRAPTAAASSNGTQIATTAFVTTAIAGGINNPAAAITANSVTASSVTMGNYTITQSGGALVFSSSGTNVMKVDASGNLTVTGDVTAFGTV